MEFDQAVSLEEERQKLEEEAQRKRDAQTAIANLEQTIKMEENKDVIIAANPSQSDDSAMTSAPTANNAQSSQSQSSSAGQSQSPSAGQSSSGSQPAASAPGKTDSSQNSSSQSGSSQIGSSGPSAGTVSSLFLRFWNW